ncbi:MAG: ammonia-forming cytochrome c nitrite reductase [Flavobacteriaceae bacterium]|nr:ammonia-forming cytochrome c nitrite reductase [Flavobacteriaceae bacterium]
MTNIRKPWMNWMLFITSLVLVFVLGIVISSIVERKTEAKYAYTPQTTIGEFEPQNEVWGQNFPREFESYYQTADTTFASKHLTNAKTDMLVKNPRLVVLFAGYGFSKDYNQGRGHYYAIEDTRNTLRTGSPMTADDGPMPSTCWTCKSPDVPRLMNEIGVDNYYKGKWASKGAEIVNPIGCADCHDAKTMNLKITRPALVEAYQRQGKDITKATHNEMRSLVCAQCHVEYYFNDKLPGKEGIKYLTFPWDNGDTAEGIEKYYDAMQFSDWTHAISKAPMIKSQHPDYEVFKSGIHAERGVSCADCHMPYKTEGGQKFTNHHIMSPLKNPANSCQVCHKAETDKLLKNVYDRQDKIKENQDKLEELLVRAHFEAKQCWDLGATEKEMAAILQDIRKGQWRWDYAASGHGNSFHAPVETGRVISQGIMYTQEARIKLAKLLLNKGFKGDVPYPNIKTKAEAQKLIGLDIPAEKAAKEKFKKEILPKWDAEAKARKDKSKK